MRQRSPAYAYSPVAFVSSFVQPFRKRLTKFTSPMPPIPLHTATRQQHAIFPTATLKGPPNSETESLQADTPTGAALLNPTLWPERFRVVFLCFLSFVICNCDRINISVAILPMAKYYGWNQTTVGIIQSAFFWGYVTTQIPGGYLADKYGGKHVLAAGVIVWSAMTLLTPVAASANIGLLLLARTLLGVGEGVAMPAMNNIISKWVPEKERARSLSLTYSGMYLGSVIGLWLCPTFIVQFGWQSVFYIFGSMGFFWWFAWQFMASSAPELSASISEKERNYIKDNTPAAKELPKKIPFGMLLSSKATWAIIIAHFCATWGTYSFFANETLLRPRPNSNSCISPFFFDQVISYY